MKKIAPLFCLLLLISSVTFGQEKSLEKSYQEYFKIPREALFLHTNKTAYLTGEEVWLKTYAFDRKNSLPSLKTRNIYVGLYDSVGKQLIKKLYLAKKGYAIGNFKLDTLLTTGTYYLKASTNWMKNFKEDDSFTQKIEIINVKDIRKKKVNTNKYDMQFLPEGGHIVAGIKNTIGFKYVNDEAKGSFISGNIYDQDNKLVNAFKSNSLGMGKFSFTPERGKVYFAKFTLDNDIEESVQLPKTEQRGIAINVNNLRNDKVIVNLRTNDETLSNLNSNDFKLLIHRDGLIKSINFKMNKKTASIPITKKELFSGINILTLINKEGTPLVERMIFNDVSFQKTSLAISEVSSDFDSISYAIRNIQRLKDDESVSLSVSILPAQTKSYDQQHNIISSLLIEPYLKGTIENPNFYFKDFGLKDKYELDILLLTQGWSKYSWKDIKNKLPKPLYDFEDGISVTGTVNSSLKNVKSFILYPTKYNKSIFIEADEKGKFNINNFLIEKAEKISFSAIMKNGKMKRPLINLSPIIKIGRDQVAANKLKESFVSFYSDKNDIPNNFITQGYEELDEVTVVVKKKERLRDPQFPNAKITQITKNIAKQYPVITDYLQNNGFDVIDGSTNGGVAGAGQIFVFSRGRGGGAAPALFIDGVITQNFNILQTITMDKVDQVLIDRTGVGLGISGGNSFGGVIKIKTRNTSLLSPNLASPDIYSTKVNYGYEPVKEFYMPKYPSYRIKTFRDYGIIHWEPNATISNLSDFKVRTTNTGTQEIYFFVEGISNKGTLFSQVTKLNAKDSN